MPAGHHRTVRPADLSSVSHGHPERIVPDETAPGIVALHLKRYVFSLPWCEDARVLDAACGVGYGCATIASVAASVVGVDRSEDAIEFARTRYPAANIGFELGDVTALRFPDASFDTVCSFETIEHVDDAGAALDSFARVLASDGVLVVSTPNAARTTRTPDNPHHRVELSRSDLELELGRRFEHVDVYGQRRRRTRRHRLMVRLDVLGLRKKLRPPRAAIRAVGTAPTASLTLDDIEIVPGDTRGATELVAVCQTPRRR
jgi:SAM-dependent methyltransferase